MFLITKKFFSTTSNLNMVQKLTKMRVVDNSSLGKEAMSTGRPPKVIHCYSKNRYAFLGQKVLLAIKGQKQLGLVVGCVKKEGPFIPYFDSNNVILIDRKEGNPIGSRILAPIPNYIKKKNQLKVNYNKIFAIAAKVI